jgi:hypothetical protein
VTSHFLSEGHTLSLPKPRFCYWKSHVFRERWLRAGYILTGGHKFGFNFTVRSFEDIVFQCWDFVTNLGGLDAPKSIFLEVISVVVEAGSYLS